MTAERAPALFDTLAADYDARFSERPAAQRLRAAVHARLAPLIAPESTVVDAGCGTGVDAAWLAQRGREVWAGDKSAEMLEVCRERAARRGLDGRIHALKLDVGDAGSAGSALPAHIDLLLANFGVLNCVADLEPFFDLARERVAPGGFVAATVMGRFCLAESVHFLLKRDAKQARRRWRGRARFTVAGVHHAVWYHSPRVLIEAAHGFTRHGLYGVGACVPPSELFGLCERFPRLLAAAAWLDRLLAPFTWPLADHYLLILRKTAATPSTE